MIIMKFLNGIGYSLFAKKIKQIKGKNCQIHEQKYNKNPDKIISN